MRLAGGYCHNNGNASPAATSGGGSGHHHHIINSNSADMDDILIVTARQSEPAILWANYLKARFDKITKQRGRLPFK